MKLLRCTVLCCLLVFAGAQLLAADVSGMWTGSFDAVGPDGQPHAGPALMKLKEADGVITGTAGPSEDQQWAINKGVIKDNKVTFEVQSDGPLIKFALELVEGHLKGEANAEHEGNHMKAKVDVTRKAE